MKINSKKRDLFKPILILGVLATVSLIIYNTTASSKGKSKNSINTNILAKSHSISNRKTSELSDDFWTSNRFKF